MSVLGEVLGAPLKSIAGVLGLVLAFLLILSFFFPFILFSLVLPLVAVILILSLPLATFVLRKSNRKLGSGDYFVGALIPLVLILFLFIQFSGFGAQSVVFSGESSTQVFQGQYVWMPKTSSLYPSDQLGQRASIIMQAGNQEFGIGVPLHFGGQYSYVSSNGLSGSSLQNFGLVNPRMRLYLDNVLVSERSLPNLVLQNNGSDWYSPNFIGVDFDIDSAKLVQAGKSVDGYHVVKVTAQYVGCDKSQLLNGVQDQRYCFDSGEQSLLTGVRVYKLSDLCGIPSGYSLKHTDFAGGQTVSKSVLSSQVAFCESVLVAGQEIPLPILKLDTLANTQLEGSIVEYQPLRDGQSFVVPANQAWSVLYVSRQTEPVVCSGDSPLYDTRTGKCESLPSFSSTCDKVTGSVFNPDTFACETSAIAVPKDCEPGTTDTGLLQNGAKVCTRPSLVVPELCPKILIGSSEVQLLDLGVNQLTSQRTCAVPFNLTAQSCPSPSVELSYNSVLGQRTCTLDPLFDLPACPSGTIDKGTVTGSRICQVPVQYTCSDSKAELKIAPDGSVSCSVSALDSVSDIPAFITSYWWVIIAGVGVFVFAVIVIRKKK